MQDDSFLSFLVCLCLQRPSVLNLTDIWTASDIYFKPLIHHCTWCFLNEQQCLIPSLDVRSVLFQQNFYPIQSNATLKHPLELNTFSKYFCGIVLYSIHSVFFFSFFGLVSITVRSRIPFLLYMSHLKSSHRAL